MGAREEGTQRLEDHDFFHQGTSRAPSKTPIVLPALLNLILTIV